MHDNVACPDLAFQAERAAWGLQAQQASEEQLTPDQASAPGLGYANVAHAFGQAHTGGEQTRPLYDETRRDVSPP